MVSKRRKRMPCDPDDGRLLLGMTYEEIERQDRAVREIIRELRSGMKRPPRRKRSKAAKPAEQARSLTMREAFDRAIAGDSKFVEAKPSGKAFVIVGASGEGL